MSIIYCRCLNFTKSLYFCWVFLFVCLFVSALLLQLPWWSCRRFRTRPMTTWNRGWVYSRPVVTTFPPLSMFLRTVKMKPEVFLLFTGKPQSAYGLPFFSNMKWFTFTLFAPSCCQTPPPHPPPYFGLTSPVYHLFFLLCTQMHTHWQTEEAHPHLSLPFIPEQTGTL